MHTEQPHSLGGEAISAHDAEDVLTIQVVCSGVVRDPTVRQAMLDEALLSVSDCVTRFTDKHPAVKDAV